MSTLLNNIKTASGLAWLVLAILPASIALAAPVANFSKITGDVTTSAPQMPAKAVSSGMALENGATVTTGPNGQAVINFQDGQVVALKSRTVFRVSDYQYNQAAPEKGVSVLSLLQGGARFVTGLIGTRNRGGWKLALPTATAGIRGTDFFAAIQEGNSYFKVNAGSISSTNAGGTAFFEAGQNAIADNASNLTKLISDSDLPAGLFNELQGMSLTGLSGPATGAAAAAGSTIGPVPAWVIGLGIGGAAVGATIASDNKATTTHH